MKLVERQDSSKEDMLPVNKGESGNSPDSSSFMVLAYHSGSGQPSDARVALIYLAGKVSKVFAVFSREWDSTIENMVDADREYLKVMKEDWLQRNLQGEDAYRSFCMSGEASAGALRPIGPIQNIDRLEDSLREDLALGDSEVSRVLQMLFGEGLNEVASQ
jgi:hypothetical protein